MNTFTSSIVQHYTPLSAYDVLVGALGVNK